MAAKPNAGRVSGNPFRDDRPLLKDRDFWLMLAGLAAVVVCAAFSWVGINAPGLFGNERPAVNIVNLIARRADVAAVLGLCFAHASALTAVFTSVILVFGLAGLAMALLSLVLRRSASVTALRAAGFGLLALSAAVFAVLFLAVNLRVSNQSALNGVTVDVGAKLAPYPFVAFLLAFVMFMVAISKMVAYRIFYKFNALFMVLVCVLILYPYINVLAVALNDNSSTVTTGLMLIPRKFTLVNFKMLLSNSQIWVAVKNTLLRIVIGVPLGLFVNFTASYALSKSYLPARKTLVFILMIPGYISAGLIPTYILYHNLGLQNSFWVYVLPVGFAFFNFILLRTYMYTISNSLEESAKIDGASDFTVMARIYLPLCMPIIATLILFSTVGHWNDWTTTLYFVTDVKLSTLAFELQRVLKEQDRIAKMIEEALKMGLIPSVKASGTGSGLRNAQIIVTTLPIIMIYPFLQRYFIHGMLVGSVKE